MSDIAENQRRDEELVLDLFLSTGGTRVSEYARPRPGVVPEPDFVATSSEGIRIGLEVVALEVTETAILDDARTKFKEELRDGLVRASANLDVRFSVRMYSGRGLVNRSRRLQLVAQVVKLAREASARVTPTRYEAPQLDAMGASELEYLQLHPRESLQVTSGILAFGPRVPHVQERIRSKETKLDAYKDALPGCDMWLLVAAGFSFAAGIWTATIEEQEFQSSFDRVFCVDGAESRVVELRLERPRDG